MTGPGHIFSFANVVLGTGADDEVPGHEYR